MIASLRAAVLAILCALPAQAADITVFAAASLGDALTDLAEAWQAETGHSVTLVLAGSSTLARQIEAGAPADIYLSANVDWMDWLAARGRLNEVSRIDVASNTLVLVAHDGAAASEVLLSPKTDIAALLGTDGRLAVALPEAVPAGLYARAGLETLGLWDDVSDRLAPTDNVRAALALVALGEAPLGVVYATDALAEPRVHVVATFPEGSHPAIAYPAALVAESAEPDVASDFLQWLLSAAAQSSLRKHGFGPPTAEPK
ncbi:molybdate transport system substrate-binding protein [Marivita hallyeonensis]|uniref:Molybdate transport system substrate-binding protein n=1 Tax=Marivita hallyeonensis TaxID=996342 RepID=A0A1M5X254_9RHOB|nr:molybdate transport system substrate-binding protein [Marivita hallyeonensis]